MEEISTNIEVGTEFCKRMEIDPHAAIRGYATELVEPDLRRGRLIWPDWGSIQIDVDALLEDEDEITIKVRRIALTEAEYAGLPEFEGD